MDLQDFDFDLPPELIAKEPVEPRDQSRLLFANRKTNSFRDLRFSDLPNLLKPGDCLVFNNTQVVPARLRGIPEGSEASVEALLTRRTGPSTFTCMVRPGKRFQPGKKFHFSGSLRATVREIHPDGTRSLDFNLCGDQLDAVLDACGEVPLPPYLRGSKARPDQYQTVYARHRGSCAAPTAGLHFTPELLSRLSSLGIHLAEVTLHVGPGTFQPVKVEDPRQHQMHAEPFSLDAASIERIQNAKKNGGRVVAVGTTTVRVLETCADPKGNLSPTSGETSIFIYPGYQWKIVDGLITNFHLPRSTLIMLVASFAGLEFTQSLYRHAIHENYRFYSFGDASIIL
ncbi:MAG: tRNA preQ1(34) S-adenosylmethionine ribosyltransferase-isomerase QueA [Puniceicoccaceae bacterium]